MESFNGIDLMPPGGSPAAAFTTCWATLPGSMRRCWPTADFMIDKGFTYCIPLHDPRQRGGGRYEPDRHGRHDVQDRRGGPVPDRHQRALHDRPVH
ncbi:MAG: hypothetical protein ACLTYN_02850 [Dysosmobacter welbionis]